MNKVHPLKTAALKFVQVMNNELKKQGKTYFYNLELVSHPQTVDTPIKGAGKDKNGKPYTRKKRIMTGNLIYTWNMPQPDGEIKRIIVHHGMIHLRDINERFNTFGWHGELCNKFLEVCLIEYTIEKTNRIAEYVKKEREETPE